MMKKIFLSASIPDVDSVNFASVNSMAVASAVMALVRVCAQRRVPIYFGGHPAISPLIWSVLKEYSSFANELLTIYQSKLYDDKVPREVLYYQNIVWTDKGADKADSLRIMRTRMFEDNETGMAVFLGGKEGVIDEFELLHRISPDTKIIPLKSTGGASAKIYDELNINQQSWADSFAYSSIFDTLVKSYKRKGIL